MCKSLALLLLVVLCSCSWIIRSEPIEKHKYQEVVNSRIGPWYVEVPNSNEVDIFYFYEDSIILYNDTYSPVVQGTEYPWNKLLPLDSLQVTARRKWIGKFLEKDRIFEFDDKTLWRHQYMAFSEYVPGKNVKVFGYSHYRYIYFTSIGQDSLRMGYLDIDAPLSRQGSFYLTSSCPLNLIYKYDFGH